MPSFESLSEETQVKKTLSACTLLHKITLHPIDSELFSHKTQRIEDLEQTQVLRHSGSEAH